MAALEPPVAALGTPAPAFSLPATDGKTYSFDDVKGAKGTVVVFMCNHCPFVMAVIKRMVSDAHAMQASGIGVVGIMSNDVQAYPDDSPAHMATFAQQHALPFPYLYDETQAVAKAYGAVCTPDYFGFDAQGGLAYRGRLDAGRLDPIPSGTARDLVNAMEMIATTGKGPETQLPSMGCSIKWR
ncbi:MAG: thioredoxin family protein [Alphaproteobacteria bacterium]|nr:thioredoxin family protein [Alphaproteobacteria bacterium]